MSPHETKDKNAGCCPMCMRFDDFQKNIENGKAESYCGNCDCPCHQTSSKDNYEQDHSHSHCYDTQEGHQKHLTCCICRKANPHLSDSKDDLIEEVAEELLRQVGMNLKMGRVDSTLEEVLIETLSDLYSKAEAAGREEASDEIARAYVSAHREEWKKECRIEFAIKLLEKMPKKLIDENDNMQHENTQSYLNGSQRMLFKIRALLKTVLNDL